MTDSKFTLFVIAGAVILIGLIVFLGGRSGGESNDTLVGQAFESEGQQHIQVGAPHEAYKTNPPTSGPHYIQPAEWGYYDQELPDEQLVHNLEHGGIWVSYQPGAISEDEKEQLKKLSQTYNQRLVVTPRSKNETALAVASWTRAENKAVFDLELIEQFLEKNVNQSPEKIAR